MYALPLTLIAGMGLAYCLIQLTGVLRSVRTAQMPKISSEKCDYKLERLEGYEYIRPLVLAEENCESERYGPLKNEISKLLEGYKTNGALHSASVFFKNLKSGEWFCLNSDEQYDPGSLIKVPVLISYLRMEENTPGILNGRLKSAALPAQKRAAIFTSKAIEPGHAYSIRELLNYMILYSDNNATSLLLNHINPQTFASTFTDLGLRPIDSNALVYPITAKEYSVFMEAIYNVAYLTIPHSEYADSILSESNFKEGLAKGIPAGIKMAHKFGEGGSYQEPQLHESGIIYLSKNPYLVTVMTKGQDVKKLPEVLGAVSNIIYSNMAQAD
jgi:beta-lactamase class A